MAQSKKKAPVAEPVVAMNPEVLPAESEEVGLVKTDGGELLSFFGNVSAFFRKAQEIETSAKSQLDRAKQAVPPKTLEEDAAMQDSIRGISRERKVLVEHWEITAIFSRVHKRLTGARNRADEMLDSAASIRQKLHNDYVVEAKRVAAEEQERLRKLEENRLREEREREQEKLEQAAVDAEAASPDLSEREDAFVHNFVQGGYGMKGNPTESARVAGFKDGNKAAIRLMQMPKIQTAIKAKQDALAIREQAAAKAKAPIVATSVPTVKAAVSRAGGFDVTNWSGEVLDEKAFINAIFEGQHGIPRDVLTIDLPKLNQYARDMKDLMNRWPGVRANSKTTTR